MRESLNLLGAIVRPLTALGIAAIWVDKVALLAALGWRHRCTCTELHMTVGMASDTCALMHGRFAGLSGRHNVVMAEHAFSRKF